MSEKNCKLKQSENVKRFSVDYDENVNRVIYFDNGEPMTFLEVVECLENQQDNIKELEKEIFLWADKISRLLDYAEEKGKVSRQDIKDWWNEN